MVKQVPKCGRDMNVVMAIETSTRCQLRIHVSNAKTNENEMKNRIK
jgi:hypothetical protein